MARGQRRRQTRLLEARFAAKCAEAEQLKAQVEELRAELAASRARAGRGIEDARGIQDARGIDSIADARGIEDARGIQDARGVVSVRKGFAGSDVLCNVHCKTPSAKAILDSYAAQERMPPKRRSLLKLVRGVGDLDEDECVDIENHHELCVVEMREPSVGLAIEFQASGHKYGTTLADLRMFNARAGVVIRVGEDICPDANTEIVRGSEVSLVLRGTGMCLKVFEIITENQANVLKDVLQYSSAHQDWTTTDLVALGNWEDCGISVMPLPAGSTLRGHRAKEEPYGMVTVKPFSLDQLRVGTRFLFQCSSLEVAMNDLNIERNEWCKRRIGLEVRTINKVLVRRPRPLGSARTTGEAIPPRNDALDVRSNTGLNVLAVQPVDGPLEWAPSTETLISKGCRLFFLQGHVEAIEATKPDGRITLEHVPFFE